VPFIGLQLLKNENLPYTLKPTYMKSRRIIVPIILLVGIMNMKVQCNRSYAQPPTYKYTFKQIATITPYQLNYQVGDTIWLQFVAQGKKLFDEKTNTLVFYDSAMFVVNAQVDLLYNNPFISDGPFASFIIPQNVSAYTQNYPNTGATYAMITTGCGPSSEYNLLTGVVLLKKGVFGISLVSNGVQRCSLPQGYSSDATLSFVFDVPDAHKDYYLQLPLVDVGKSQQSYLLQNLDKKSTVVINVQ
jgi:hypothetical protein